MAQTALLTMSSGLPDRTSLHPILLLLADLTSLREVSLSLFKHMRALIAAQPRREHQIGMAVEVERMLRRRFKAQPLEIESWKQSMGQQWQASDSPSQFRSILDMLLQRVWRTEPPAAPLRAELRLAEHSGSNRVRIYQGRDNRGMVRVALQVEHTGQARVRSYDLNTGVWRKQNFALRNPSVPPRALALTALEHTASACGWRCPHW